jgi:hypothetical protein
MNRYGLVTAGLVLTALAFPAGDARAAANRDAKIMLHALSPTVKNACNRTGLRPANCTGFVTNNLELYPSSYFAYVLVVEGSLGQGVAGVQFGIDYPGPANGATDGDQLDIWGWTLCATIEFVTPPGGAINAWPNPDSGTLITWDANAACQITGNVITGVVAVAGYFYCGSYAPTLLRIVPRQVDGYAKVADCASVEDIVYTDANDNFTYLGALGFGRSGINPCGRIGCFCSPVVGTSWSGVKTLLH